MIHVAELSDIQRELMVLEADMKRLEAEYNMFFAGRLPRPPFETRSRVVAQVHRLDRTHLSNHGDRFRFTTLQARLATFIGLWDRGLRAREEGRPGPFAQLRTQKASNGDETGNRVVFVTSLADPLRERQKIRDLYNKLSKARRETGQETVAFSRFAELVRTQVTAVKRSGSAEIAFCVSVKDGKVAFTARVPKVKK
jgi:hypothetical protein